MIVEIINEKYMVIADGDLRKMHKPKLKNIKHLQLTNMKARELLDYLERGEQLEDHVIRKCLKKLQGMEN